MLPGENFRFSYISQEHHIFWPLMQDEPYEGLQHTFLLRNVENYL